MHVHPSSPNFINSPQSEEIAAIKIQAGFRGYRVRKRLSCQQIRHPINGYHHHHQYRQSYHHPSNTQSRLRHYRKMERNLSSGEISAARAADEHELKKSSHQEGDAANEGSSSSSSSPISSIEDRCAAKIQAGVRGFLVRKKQKVASNAATKIQAGFRGFKARKEAEKLKQK